MRGVMAPIFGLLAVAAIVLGVLNAVVWKPSADITAAADVTGSRYVVTDPGVLPLLDRNATLSVDSGSSADEICVALGSAKDVTGWVSSAKSYTRITGMSSWTELGTQSGKGTATGADASGGDADADGADAGDAADAGSGDAGDADDAGVALKDSDMWHSVKCGKGSATLDSKKSGSSTVAIVDLGKDDANATVSLHWVRSEVPDFAMPFYLSGGLLVVIAVLCASVFAMPPHKRRKRMVEGKAGTTQLAGEEALGTAMSARPASVPPARRKRHRHASHRRGGRQKTPIEPVESPAIIDPASRNLVADQQSAAAGTTLGDNESTSVIAPDELQAYFARLAQEVNEENTADGEGQEQSR
jgi:hypothetical protein